MISVGTPPTYTRKETEPEAAAALTRSAAAAASSAALRISAVGAPPPPPSAAAAAMPGAKIPSDWAEGGAAPPPGALGRLTLIARPWRTAPCMAAIARSADADESNAMKQ